MSKKNEAPKGLSDHQVPASNEKGHQGEEARSEGLTQHEDRPQICERHLALLVESAISPDAAAAASARCVHVVDGIPEEHREAWGRLGSGILFRHAPLTGDLPSQDDQEDHGSWADRADSVSEITSMKHGPPPPAMPTHDPECGDDHSR